MPKQTTCRLASWVLVMVCLIFGQASTLLAQQYSIQRFTAVDGLPQSEVNAMIEDKNGYLWLGTAGGGLARFDGKNFKVYTTLDGLLSNMITSLMIDSHENLWIIHSRGISKFNGTSFKKFPASGLQTGQGRFRRLYELGDTIFFTSSPGVLGKIYQDSAYYWYKPIEKDKLIYFGTRSGDKKSLYFYLSDSSFLMMSKAGEKKRLSHKSVFGRVYSMMNYNDQLMVSSDLGYYLVNKDFSGFEKSNLQSPNHIVAYDSLTQSVWSRSGSALLKEHHGTIDTVLNQAAITQILFDKEGNTWIGTMGAGLFKYAIRDFDRCSSDKLGSIMAIMMDRGGATWLGSTDVGVIRMKKGKSKRYFIPDGRSTSITSLAQDGTGQIWAGSFRGLGKYDSAKDAFRWYTREDGLSSQFITTLLPVGNQLWFGSSDGGVMHYADGKFEAYPVGLGKANAAVFALYFHPTLKKLFAGSEMGLHISERGKFDLINYLPELNNSTILSINPFRDSLMLIGTAGAGVIIFDPVTRYRKVISSREGLRSNLIYFVAEDAEHDVWVGTEQGIHLLKLSTDFEIERNQHFNHHNGLTGVETNHNAFYLGKDKFFGLIDGVYQFNDDRNKTATANALHLTGVEIFYGKEDGAKYSNARSGFFKIPQQLSLPPDKNHITFNFSRVDKRNPESVRYKYFLRNFDKQWSPPTAQGMITYGNLPPGNYELNVLATDKLGSWDTNPLTYTFIVQAPFYQRAYFLISMTFLAISLTILYFYWRVRQRVSKMLEVERIRQQEQDHLRKEIARDFHDEMGNQLTRIINYISLIKISKNGQVVDLYNKVEESAKYLYSGTRDFIWSIDPVNDELSKLFIHIRDFGEKLFEEKGIQFRAFNEIKEPVKVPYGFCREVNLIFKEAMTNAFNHSHAKNVSFYLRKKSEGFEMVLEDDGKGFAMEHLQQPNGLKNMRSRAERIRSILRINGKRPEGGTIVALQSEIKINKEKHAITI